VPPADPGIDPDFSGFHTLIEDEATPAGRPAGLATLDWATNGRDSDGRPILEVTVTAQLVLQGMASKADYYGDDNPSVEVYDIDWNNHYMWVGTNHTGRLSLTFYLTQHGAALDEVEFLEAEVIYSEALTSRTGTCSTGDTGGTG
jgi:hypothetical protein